MQVQVRLSGGLADQIGLARLNMTVQDGATVADLKAALCKQYPALKQGLDVALPVTGGRHIALTEPLMSGQEVAFLLPVAGG